MVFRVFVDKGCDSYESRKLLNHFHNTYSLYGMKKIRVFERYDVDGLSWEEFEQVCKENIFQESYEKIYYELPSGLNMELTFALTTSVSVGT